LWFSSGLLAVYYGPDWPGITALLAGENGYMQMSGSSTQCKGKYLSFFVVSTVALFRFFLCCVLSSLMVERI